MANVVLLPAPSLSMAAVPQLPISDGRLSDFVADPICFMRRLYDEHGPIAALREGTQDVVFAFGPELNQQILTDVDRFHSRFFGIRGPRKSAQRRLTCGLLSMNGETHRRHRRLVMQPFANKSIEKYFEALVAMTDELLATWRAGQVLDVHEEMTRYMLRVTSTILFGFDEAELAYRVGHMIERWVEMNHAVGAGAIVPSQTFSQQYEELLAYAEELEETIAEMIQLRRQTKDTGDDVLSILVRSHDEQGGLTDDELIGQAAILFAAAHLTTASSLTWSLFLLAQHPSAMCSLHQELCQVLAGSVPELADLERLIVTEQAIKESLRVLPASSYSVRMSVEPVELGPFLLPRGTAVIFSQFITHHMPELFPQPDQFIPDRWQSISPSPYAYLPFAAGPRMCLGARLAMMMMQVALPMILQRFRLAVVPGEQYSGLVTSTMLSPTTPIRLELFEQDGQFEAHPIRGNLSELVTMTEVPQSV